MRNFCSASAYRQDRSDGLGKRQLKLLVHDQCVDIWPEQQRLKWWAKELEDAQALGKAGVFPGGGRVELQLKASCAMFCGGHTSSKV
jgi:hypothetical protein